MPARSLFRSPTLAVLLVLVLVQTGCRNKSAPETTAPQGFVAVRDADAGFAIAVPADWIQIPLPQDLDKFDEQARELSAKNDNLGPAIVQARQLLQFGGVLMAVSPDGNSRVNLTIDKTREKSLDEIATSTVKSLKDNGATDLNQENTTTAAGEAVKLTFRYPLPGRGEETVIADEVQYYGLRKGKSYVITVINGSADLANAVAASFRLR